MTGIRDEVSFPEIKDLANSTIQMFIDETFDELYLFYNHFVSAISQEVTEKKLLPLSDIAPNKKELPMNLNRTKKKFWKCFCLSTLRA